MPDGFVQRLKENPLVTLGCIATTAMLVGGLASFRQGNAARSQQMMRARVVAQGATLVIIGAALYSSQQQNHEMLQASLSSRPPPAHTSS